MDDIRWLIDKLPIPLVLHEKNKILHANTEFKNFLTAEQSIENLSLLDWLSEVIKQKDQCELFFNNIDSNNDVTITAESYVKGVLRYWSISSFLLPSTSGEKTRITCFQDVSAVHGKKSYWDLHLRVSKATMQLVKEIAERKKLEIKTAELNSQLLITARHAGMADVATSILHNIGNILNSVKVSVEMLRENIHKLELQNIAKIVDMLISHLDDATKFLTEDPKGKLIPKYLTAFNQSVRQAQIQLDDEAHSLMTYVQHIEDIVAMQKSTSGVVKVSEKLLLSEILDNSIQLCGKTFEKNNIEVQKVYGDKIILTSDKFKILQIMVNLLQNAKDALLLSDVDVPVKIIGIKIEKHDNNVDILISDNGVGIEPENLTKIFSLGFTTKQQGHGFGLHGSALAAKELGGKLQVKSAGIGKGSTFILTLPIATAPEVSIIT
jgi:signal transduction histidine kinase